jgi:hypothetical protein
MKKIFPLFLLAFLIGCSNNSTVKSATETSKEETNSTSASTASTSSNSPQGDGLVGYWKLSLEAYDDNNNGKLDDEERKKGIQNRYSFRFNADGSCQIMDMFKGRYERKTEKGKDVLSVYRNRIPQEEEKDPPPDVYIISSIAKDKMILLETMGNHVFWEFSRQ